MSRKYISQVLSQNFVYPNNKVSEYDNEIVHDINNNSVSGIVNSFSATTFNSTGLTISYNCTWNRNGAEPYIGGNGLLNLFSVHMLAQGQNYYKPYRMVFYSTNNLTTVDTATKVGTFTVTPAMMGLASFSSGTYYFEVRFIGKRAVYPVCVNLSLAPPTPTPTPTVTPTPTATPTPTPTPTVTVTPTPTPDTCTQPNVCMALVVTGATGPEMYAGTISYNDCDGVLVNEQFTTRGVRYRCVQYTSGLPQIFSYTGMEEPTISSGNCNTFECYTGVTQLNYLFTLCDSTPGAAPSIVVSDAQLISVGKPSGTPPTTGDTIEISGSGNVGACYSFAGNTTDAASVSPVPLSWNVCTCTLDPTPTPTATATPTPTPTATATPTPTPTSTPTVTPTPTPGPTCVTSVSFDVDSAGTVTYYNCCGSPITNFYGIGPQVINDCITNGSVFGSGAVISNITYNSTSCSCVTPTPTPTATSTPTPTPTSTPVTTSTFNWTYNQSGGASGEMILYINGSVVEDRFGDASGTFNVNVGDTINCEVITNGCTSPNGSANSYCIGIIADASCSAGSSSMFTSIYTVTSGDVGNTITLNMYSACDSACV